MRVALAQVDCLLGDTDENLRRAKEVVAEARDRDADLTVFPELSLSGYALGNLGDVRRRREVPLVKEARLALLAREFNRLAEEGGDL